MQKVTPKEQEETIRQIRTNDIIANKFPALANKIAVTKSGMFVQVEDIIMTCVDKKNMEKSIKNFVISLRAKEEEIDKKHGERDDIIENFLEDIDTLIPDNSIENEQTNK